MIIVTSCYKKEQKSSLQGLYEYEQTQRNIDYNNLALIVSHALSENKDFRHLVKEEALYTFDGDYDILISHLKDLHIKNATGNKIKVSEFLNGYAKQLLAENKLQGVAERSMQEYIDYLSQQYPNLQISVPVHAEDWTDDYVPVVTFIPEELDDNQNVDIVAYKGNETTSVNSITPPNEPAVVVGDNERLPNNPNNYTGAINVDNFTLQASQTTSGIHLEWNYTNISGTILGFHIYRKATNETSFSLIGSTYGTMNLIYDDISVSSNQHYSYYITAYNLTNESNRSNIVLIQAPNRPEPLSSFNVLQFVPNFLNIRWDLPQNQAVTYVEIEKLTLNDDNQYQPIGNFDDSYREYLYQNPIPGKQMLFRARIVDNNYTSNYKYDYIRIPYRDISRPTPTYIEYISFNWDEINTIEHWLKGAPEFAIAVVVTDENGNKHIVQDGIYLNFCVRHSWNFFNDINVYDWKPHSFLDMMTFKVKEHDGGSQVDVTFTAGSEQKNTITTDNTTQSFTTKVGLSVTVHDIFNKKDDDIGTGYLQYTDPETTWVSIPGSLHFKMLISTHDNQHNCYP